jgi:hypothetical protein
MISDLCGYSASALVLLTFTTRNMRVLRSRFERRIFLTTARLCAGNSRSVSSVNCVFSEGFMELRHAARTT